MLRAVRSWPRRIRDSADKEGTGHFALRAALSPVYRRAALRALPLDHEEKTESPFASTALTVRLATEGDAGALAALHPKCTPELMRARLRAGEEC